MTRDRMNIHSSTSPFSLNSLLIGYDIQIFRRRRRESQNEGDSSVKLKHFSKLCVIHFAKSFHVHVSPFFKRYVYLLTEGWLRDGKV